MHDSSGEHYNAAAVIGGGLIGASWTALFLTHGLRVTVHDPRPDIEPVVRAGLRAVAPTLKELGMDVANLVEDTGTLRFDANLAAAVADADVVQENAPERLELKQQLWAAIEAAAKPDALLASSSSALPATAIAEQMRQPERLIIAHPFNPPHLVPLVEVVPGPRTDPALAERAVAFYKAMGKRPQLLRREIPGFVANRLQGALFRESVHLVSQGVVTEQELDEIVTSSIGLRWAIAGPFQTYHLGGGPRRPAGIPGALRENDRGDLVFPRGPVPRRAHRRAARRAGTTLRRHRGAARHQARPGDCPTHPYPARDPSPRRQITSTDLELHAQHQIG